MNDHSRAATSQESRETLRLFLALDIPDSVTAALDRLIAPLKKRHNRTVKWVDPANLHLTAKFFGDTPPSRVPALCAAVEKTLADNPGLSGAFALRVSALGAFPNLRRPRVFWSDLDGEQGQRLARFVAKLDQGFAALGVAPEERAFKPHLTLGRPRRGADVSVVAREFAALKPEPLDVVIDTLTLYQSTLTREGPIYDELKSWRLAERFG